MKVAIVGAGIGGLALAQGLLKAGVEVRVFERDPSPVFRRQGYRIHVSPAGEEALAAVLPERVRRRVIETATRPGDLLAGFDTQLNALFEQTFPIGGPDSITSIDRYAFRRAMMTGLDEFIAFGKEFASYGVVGEGVEIRFADGTTEVADVLVGADGAGSRVRAQLLPEFEVHDSGIRCIYGKIPLTDAVRAVVPPSFLRGFCFVQGAAFAPVLFRTPPEEYGDYLMAVLTGTSEQLGRTDDELFAMPAEELWSLVGKQIADWHPVIGSLVSAADASAAFPIALRTCTSVMPWPEGPVVLLGDAVHPMLPSAGAGANTALWDAARLTDALTGGSTLASYQEEMLEHGMAAVTESLENGRRMFDLRTI
ncbi:FAD-dependent monooxygenase [Kribbella antibiotica]|uniref:FAD-dependent monooxygenase n=1 Tax=Kribbella antibiotica TaxID=190195 RepID=A0A4R4YWX4_9ACTN|nr:NAD(P)/FAD-dependent oxidoreductase [Kribbella antibiotica]TDD49975.1 FAD-dependent monooxygenase [Kribbella antibiotica]